ncbi:2-dehydro-3-deoxy-6-phosphogalactonate aldolase [Sphingomonas sp.]|uniref:2-dehydro-3-deoxy-6-phosphogalactonate aldolase n=1 Tax=Sphingomonas sp. TaxID=28214 RepID=UPI003D6D0ACF
MIDFDTAAARLPLVAILRGVRPDKVVAIGEALVEAGFVLIEVPLNSPQPFDSISRLAAHLGDHALIGAGTVLDSRAAQDAVDAGARLLLAPNFVPEMVATARANRVASMPGVATATEAFAALGAGADALKLFPARELGAGTIAAWRAVLPASAWIFAVGGVDETGFAAFTKAGASGFGLGSSLYRAGDDAATVSARAVATVAAWQELGQ